MRKKFCVLLELKKLLLVNVRIIICFSSKLKILVNMLTFLTVLIQVHLFLVVI